MNNHYIKIEPFKKFKDSDEAREYLKKFMNSYFSDKTFGKYIDTKLAGDFVFQLANAIEPLASKI